MNEAQISEIISKMTLREKLGQMSQVNGEHDDNLARIREGRVGSFLNVNDPKVCNEYQKIALEESPNGVPLIVGRDVIHGYRTIFPIPLGQAASWNPELSERAARIVAREASTCGINWTFAPMVEFELHTDDLRSYDRDLQFVTEPGAFQVWIAGDSASGVSREFRVE